MPHRTADFPPPPVGSAPPLCQPTARDPVSQPFGSLVMHRSEVDAALVLAVEGELAVDTVGLFRHVYTDAFQRVATDAQSEKGTQEKGILVDLSRCCFVDSAGLLALVETQKEAQEAGIPLVFVSLSPFVDHVLQTSRLFRLLTIAATTQEAQQRMAAGRTKSPS